jgi:hypothetical protein
VRQARLAFWIGTLCVATWSAGALAATAAAETATTNAPPADPNVHRATPMAKGAKLAVLGTESNPWRTLSGSVATLVQEDEGGSITFRTVGIPAAMRKIFYRGREMTGGYAKVKEGKVGELTVGGLKLELNANELPEGALDTKELGAVRLMFRTPMNFDEGFFLILTDKQLSDLRERLKKGPAPAPAPAPAK